MDQRLETVGLRLEAKDQRAEASDRAQQIEVTRAQRQETRDQVALTRDLKTEAADCRLIGEAEDRRLIVEIRNQISERQGARRWWNSFRFLLPLPFLSFFFPFFLSSFLSGHSTRVEWLEWWKGWLYGAAPSPSGVPGM